MKRMQDKIVIVTGGGRGMGAATVRALAHEGARVTIADVLAEDGQALVEELGAHATFLSHDVTSEESWKAIVAEVLARYGRIDALVNNAGICALQEITEITPEEIDRIFGVNVTGPLLGMKHVGSVMKSASRGSIVNISSVDALRGVNSLTVYSASKWAIRGATKSAALEFGPFNVRVNSVHPGGIDTAMGNPQNQQGEERNWAYGRVPLQRIGEPSEVAAASLFLCSDEASYITGAELAVDGGWAAGFYHAFLPTAPHSIREAG